MENPLEQKSIPELATLLKSIEALVTHYRLGIDGVIINVDEEIDGMYNAVDETSNEYKRRIAAILVEVSNRIEYEEQNDRTVGFKFGNADKPET